MTYRVGPKTLYRVYLSDDCSTLIGMLEAKFRAENPHYKPNKRNYSLVFERIIREWWQAQHKKGDQNDANV